MELKPVHFLVFKVKCGNVEVVVLSPTIKTYQIHFTAIHIYVFYSLTGGRIYLSLIFLFPILFHYTLFGARGTAFFYISYKLKVRLHQAESRSTREESTQLASY